MPSLDLRSRVTAAWQGTSTDFRRLAFMAVVDSAGTGLFLASSVVVFTRLVGISTEQVALGLTLAGVLSVASSFPAGILMDRFGPRALMAVTSLWRACGLLAYCWCHSFGSFLAVTCFLAVADRASPPITQALVAAVVEPRARVRSMAGLRALRNVGFTLGALLASVALGIDSRPAYLTILVADAASFVAVVFLLIGMAGPGRDRSWPGAAGLPTRLRLRRALPVRRHRVSPDPGAAAVPGVTAVLRDVPFLNAMLLNAVLSLHITLLAVGVPIWVIDHTSAPTVVLAPLLALNTILAVAFQVRLSRGTSSVPGACRALRRAGLSLAGCCALLAVIPALPSGATIPTLFAAIIALTAAELWQSAGGWGVSYALAPQARQGVYLSTFNMGTTTQQVFGPALVVGVVIPAGGWGWGTLIVALLVVAAVVPRAVRPGRRDDPQVAQRLAG